MESPPDGSVPAAQDVSALEFGAVVTRRGVTEYLMGFLEDGSVVTWRRVPKSLMALKRRFCRCVPKALLGSPEVWLRRHVGRGPAVSDGSSGRRFFPRLRGNLRAVLFLFSSFVSLVLVNGCTLWPQPGASGSVVIVAAATGPMTGMNTLTNSPLSTAFEGVSSRLEMQRRVDEISAAQCRKRKLAETSYSSKSATCKEATARLQSAESCSGDTCWCPQCPRYVVDEAFVQGHVVAHGDEK